MLNLTIKVLHKVFNRKISVDVQLAGAVGVPVDRRSGSRLAMMLVAIENIFIFFLFFSSVVTFSLRTSVWVNKLILRHLSRPHRPFWGPLTAILGFEGGACGEGVPPAPIGWFHFWIGCIN